MKYIDTHSHIHDHYYDADREEVLFRMRDAQVGSIAVGTSFDTSKKAAAFAAHEPDIWACIGVHPNDTNELFDADAFARLIGPKVVAVGECGLDYFRNPDTAEKRRQLVNFEAHIDFAATHKLPLMLHVRPSKGSTDAHDDAVAILAAGTLRPGARGTSHFFTAPLSVAQKYWSLGFATSFPGVITFAKECEAVVRECPLDLMLSETDAPYATPVPYRGQRNEPAYVVEIVKAIASIKQIDERVVAGYLIRNAESIFGLAIL